MVVCMANGIPDGITYEQLAEELNNFGIWKSISVFQKVYFNRRFAIVVEYANTRDLLVEKGLNLNGVHIIFA